MAKAKPRRSNSKPRAQQRVSSRPRKKSRKASFKQAVANRRLVMSQWLARRPHRSFRRTYRRDHVRSLKLPGYVGFTRDVLAMLRVRRRVFLGLIAIMSAATALLANIMSQQSFLLLSSTLTETGGDIFSGNWGEIGRATLLLVSFGGGGLSAEINSAQQLLALLIATFVWLATVWLLRAQLAGGKPRLRDALYSSGAPFLPTLLITVLLLIQLIPAAIGVIGISSALSGGVLGTGLLPFVVSLIGLLLVILSIYLVVSTFFALIVITLPGMYPWQALKTAGDLVTGRRLRILYRLLWMVLLVVVVWFIVMVPIIILVSWLQRSVEFIASLPIVPVSLVIVSTAGLVFSSSYIYLLYRKVVDDDANPA